MVFVETDVPCINKNLVSTRWIMVSSLWKMFNSRKGDCFQQQQNSFHYTENISLKAMCDIRKVVFALQNMTSRWKTVFTSGKGVPLDRKLFQLDK